MRNWGMWTVLLVVGLAAAPMLSGAALVTVTNPGFETGDITGWTLSGNPATTYARTYASVYPPGVGTADPAFVGWEGDYFAQVGYGADQEFLQQVLDGSSGNDNVTFQAGYVYTFTVQVGRPDGGYGGEYGFRLALKSSEEDALLDLLDFYDEGGLHPGQPGGPVHIVESVGWMEAQLQYTVEEGDPYIGDHVLIVLGHTLDRGSGVYDEVTLDVSSLNPEGTMIVIR